MQYSVVKSNNDMYRITITSSTDEEKRFLERPISEIKEKVHQHFDQAVKEKLGENASIASVADDSGLPYQIYALISLR
jgi:hypothetical protein